mgnify:CR=1 FL=1
MVNQPDMLASIDATLAEKLTQQTALEAQLSEHVGEGE